MDTQTINTDFDIYKCNYIAFLNGQPGLHETEAALFKRLAAHNFNNLLILDNLFKFPKRIKVLKLIGADTIVVGSTGTYHAEFMRVFNEFKKLKYLPKTALVTMGEDYFYEYKDAVNILCLMPMTYSTSDIVIWKKD